MPYLIGPNKAAMTPIRNRATNRSSGESNQKPAIAMQATAISTSLSRRATTDLSKRSATSPPIADRMKYGKMKIAVASPMSASAFGPAHLKRIRNASAFLRKLSLKALKNWHQNSGANRRVTKRLDDIGGVQALIFFAVSGVAVDQPTTAFFDFPSHASFRGLLPASHIPWSIRPVPLCGYGFQARRARAGRPAM